MIWLIFEALLALALFVFIIWWTLPRKPRRDKGKLAQRLLDLDQTEHPPRQRPVVLHDA